MKKLSIALFIFLTSMAVTANETPKLGVSIDQGFGITAQYKDFNAFVGSDGVSADYIFKRGSFADDFPVNWYIGAGAFIGWDKGNGVRAPLGLNLPFNSKWDAFFQVHPLIDFDHGHDSETKFGVDASFGVRYQF